MQKCSLTIVTTADGQETNFSCEAELEIAPLSACLHYLQDGAKNMVRFADRKVTIQREGDYSMQLLLEEGKTHQGKLLLGGNEGSFPVMAKKVAYAITDKSLLASLHYFLMFDGEAQEMKIRLNAREIYSEEK